MPKVTIIDYGVGNLLSVCRGFEKSGADVVVSNDPGQILMSEFVVLPGVGAFGNAMEALNKLKLVPVILEIANRGTPLLCICLGMQLLLEESEEFGKHKGLGLIDGKVKKMPDTSVDGKPLKIPHIGWNGLVSDNSIDWRSTVLADNQIDDPMYFVHSFMAIPSHDEHRLANCIYGGHLVPAVIGRENVIGCQFHPEKSGSLGLKLLSRFINL